MNIIDSLNDAIAQALNNLYDIHVTAADVVLQETRKEFVGDYTLVVFPYVKQARKSPEAVASEIGAAVKNLLPLVKGYNVVKGFLNLEVADEYWASYVWDHVGEESYGYAAAPEDAAPVVVEYSSPNTNKPLHLGPSDFRPAKRI